MFRSRRLGQSLDLWFRHRARVSRIIVNSFHRVKPILRGRLLLRDQTDLSLGGLSVGHVEAVLTLKVILCMLKPLDVLSHIPRGKATYVTERAIVVRLLIVEYSTGLG